MQLGDETQAFQHYSEAHRLLPVSIDVISWLGGHYIASELYEKAVAMFDRAAAIQPQEPKWVVWAASCLRKTGALQQAFSRFQSIHAKFPHDIECLKALVALSGQLGKGELAVQYVAALRKAEQAAPPPPPTAVSHTSFDDGRPSSQTGSSAFLACWWMELTLLQCATLHPLRRRRLPSSLPGRPCLGCKQQALLRLHRPRPSVWQVKRCGVLAELFCADVAQIRLKTEEDDEWADTTLGDDMLPM